MQSAAVTSVRGTGRALAGGALDLAYESLAPECRFVVVTTGRTGSELLVSLLDSHPAIRCDSEILAVPRLSANQFVLQRAAGARRRGASAYGFKLIAHHAAQHRPSDPDGFIREFARRGLRFIVLERRDWLQQAISSVRAAADRHHYRESDRATFAPTRMDPIAVVAALFWIEGAVEGLRAALAGLPQLTLHYEDDLSDPERQQRSVESICDFLGLPPATVKSDLVRLSPKSLRDQVENFDEIAAVLYSTRYAELLAGAAG